MKKIIQENAMACIALFVMLIFQAVQGIDKAGRWQYSEFSAMAERLLSGKGLYTNILLNDYSMQSIYFPGMPYLIALLKTILTSNDAVVLILVVTLSTVLLSISLFRLSIKFGVSVASVLLSLAISFSLFFDFFLFYLTEAKVDALLIAFSIFILLLINNILEDRRGTYRKLFILFILFILIGVLKQQSIAIFFGFFVYLFLNNSSSKKIRAIIGSVMMLSVALLLVIVFSNDNAYLITVNIPASHQFSPFLDSAKMIFSELEKSWFYASMVMAYIFVNYKKIMNNELLKMWFIVSTIFFAISIVSFLKAGGNEGNIQSGMVMFVPFFALMIDYLIKTSSKFKTVIVFILFISILKNTMLAVNSYGFYLSNSQERHSIQKFLKENFYGSRAVFRSDDYFTLKKSGLVPIDSYDIYTQAISIVNEPKMPVNKNIDIIYGVGMDMHSVNYDGFAMWNSSDMPKKLINNLYVRE